MYVLVNCKEQWIKGGAALGHKIGYNRGVLGWHLFLEG